MKRGPRCSYLPGLWTAGAAGLALSGRPGSRPACSAATPRRAARWGRRAHTCHLQLWGRHTRDRASWLHNWEAQGTNSFDYFLIQNALSTYHISVPVLGINVPAVNQPECPSLQSLECVGDGDSIDLTSNRCWPQIRMSAIQVQQSPRSSSRTPPLPPFPPHSHVRGLDPDSSWSEVLKL